MFIPRFRGGKHRRERQFITPPLDPPVDGGRASYIPEGETNALLCIILLGLRPTPSPRKLGHGVLPPHCINIGSSPLAGEEKVRGYLRAKPLTPTLVC
jgi:hypothetical protein